MIFPEREKLTFLSVRKWSEKFSSSSTRRNISAMLKTRLKTSLKVEGFDANKQRIEASVASR
jgi:hypothetical protein